jgi:hypothetical protein
MAPAPQPLAERHPRRRGLPIAGLAQILASGRQIALAVHALVEQPRQAPQVPVAEHRQAADAEDRELLADRGVDRRAQAQRPVHQRHGARRILAIEVVPQQIGGQGGDAALAAALVDATGREDHPSLERRAARRGIQEDAQAIVEAQALDRDRHLDRRQLERRRRRRRVDRQLRRRQIVGRPGQRDRSPAGAAPPARDHRRDVDALGAEPLGGVGPQAVAGDRVVAAHVVEREVAVAGEGQVVGQEGAAADRPIGGGDRAGLQPAAQRRELMHDVLVVGVVVVIGVAVVIVVDQDAGAGGEDRAGHVGEPGWIGHLDHHQGGPAVARADVADRGVDHPRLAAIEVEERAADRRDHRVVERLVVAAPRRRVQVDERGRPLDVGVVLALGPAQAEGRRQARPRGVADPGDRPEPPPDARLHDRGIEVAADHEDGSRGHVVAVDEGAGLGLGRGRDLAATDPARVGVIGAPHLAIDLAQHVGPGGLALGLLLEDDVALAHEPRAGHRAARGLEAPGLELEQGVEAIGQGGRGVVGHVVGREGVEAEREAVQLVEQRRAGAVAGDLERKVFGQVSQPAAPRRVLGRADLVAHVDRHQVGPGVGRQGHDHAVGQLEELDVAAHRQAAAVGLEAAEVGLARAAADQDAERADEQKRVRSHLHLRVRAPPRGSLRP